MSIYNDKKLLYIVATPIGNLDDMTFRAVNTLKEVDIIAAEDTRKAKILLSKFDIPGKRIISHHVQNEHKSKNSILNELMSGHSVAVISEAGCPCVSDPGFLIIREAIRNGIEPVFIPGVSAVTFTAMTSGLPSEKFTFLGFLPPKKGARLRALEEIKNSEITSYIFESPMRVVRLLGEIEESIGPDCGIALIREATKLHEEVIRGSVKNILEDIGDKKLKGEFVVAVSPRYLPD